MNLFDYPIEVESEPESLGPGAVLLRRFALPRAPSLLHVLQRVVAAAPFRHMVTPGGFRMSVAMTNCGAAGWVTDRNGYRYECLDPVSGQHWPSMPTCFAPLASEAALHAGFEGFVSDACLINRYEPGASLSLHQDRNERVSMRHLLDYLASPGWYGLPNRPSFQNP